MLLDASASPAYPAPGTLVAAKKWKMCCRLPCWVEKMALFLLRPWPNLCLPTGHWPPRSQAAPEHKLRFDLEGTTRILLLRGVIYFGNIHFTSRIISSDGRVWFHDGIGTGRACVDENYLDS
ncbi:hypothetical protein DFH09DRAFT_155008, partial [Mycena vulgaris]